MKKFIISLILLLFASWCQADVVIYRGTIAAGAAKFSLVSGGATASGGAFFDFGDASHIRVGDKVCFQDSAKKNACIYAKSVGTEETLSSDALAGLDFTSGWTPTRTTVLTATSFISTGSAGQSAIVSKSSTVATVGQLSKIILAGTVTAGTLQLQDGGGNVISANNATSYWTVKSGGVTVSLWNQSAGNGSTTSVSTMTYKQVRTPSSTGFVGTSTPGGSTYNWTSIDSGFDPACTGGCNYWVYDTVATMSLSGGKLGR